MEEVNKRVAESIMSTLDRFDTLDLNSKEASVVVQQVAELYKALTTHELEEERLKLDQQIAFDKQLADEAVARNDKRTFWLGVADVFTRFCLGASNSVFNAAIFQNLLEAEKDVTIGSTSMKTFLRGGFKIFKNTNM